MLVRPGLNSDFHFVSLLHTKANGHHKQNSVQLWFSVQLRELHPVGVFNFFDLSKIRLLALTISNKQTIGCNHDPKTDRVVFEPDVFHLVVKWNHFSDNFHEINLLVDFTLWLRIWGLSFVHWISKLLVVIGRSVIWCADYTREWRHSLDKL